MKKICVLTLIFGSFGVGSLTAQAPAFDTAAYTLPCPAKWQKEIFAIPIDFAPSIPYTGQEELRFAPGWGDVTTPDYWSYAFVWLLNGQPDITQEGMQENIQHYYSGLIRRNIEKRKIDPAKLFPVQVNLHRVVPGSMDQQAYEGEIRMLDYMNQRPMLLHLRFSVRQCLADRTMILFDVSPAEKSSAIREQLAGIIAGVKCSVR